MRKAFLFIGIITLSALASAQHFPKKNKYSSIGLTFNAINYVGDVDPAPNMFSPALRFTRGNLGGVISHRFSPRMHARAAFSWGRLKGDDAINSTTVGDDLFRHQRNLSFRNDIYETKIDLIWDFFPNRRGLQRRLSYTPYLMLGVAGFYHNPKAKLDGKWISLHDIGTEGQFIDAIGEKKAYSLFQPAIPFGIGFRYKLASSWDLSFEIGWRVTFTDYLDDVGGNYVDKQNFAFGSDAYWLSDRAVTPEMYNQFELLTNQELEAQGFYRVIDGKGVDHYYKPGYGRGENSIDEWRGDKQFDNDWYIVTGFHLNYIFHPKVVCPKFRG